MKEPIEIGCFSPSDLLERQDVVKIAGHYFWLDEFPDNQFRIWVEKLRDQFPCQVRAIIAQGAKTPREIFTGFARCNFANLDDVPDIDEDGNFNPELVKCDERCSCPLNGIKCVRSC